MTDIETSVVNATPPSASPEPTKDTVTDIGDERTQDLNSRLAAIQSDATNNRQLGDRTNDGLWGCLATTLIWDKDASRQAGYKESLYAARGIKFKPSKDGRTNFNPLIRLVWGYDDDLTPSDRVTISTYARALNRLDEYYAEHRSEGQHNPEGKLKAFIQEKGGVAGLVYGVPDTEDDESEPEPGGKKSNKRDLLDDADIQTEIARHSIADLKSREHGLGSVNVSQPVRVGGDGLLVLLARHDGDRQVTILGSCNEPTQIDAVVASTASRDLSKLPYSLRSLTSVIATQVFPPHALPSSSEERSKWFREKYNEESEVRSQEKAMTSAKWVVLRGKEQDVLLSGSRVSVSPVTRCVLKSPLIGAADVLLLKTDERALTERWIASGAIVLMQAEPAEQLKRVEEDEKAAYKLFVTNRATGVKKSLHFYEHKPSKARYQAEFKPNRFKAAWTVAVDARWFAAMRERWTDPWFAGLGRYNHIIRPQNATLEIEVSHEQFTIHYNMDGDRPSASKAIPFPEPIADLPQSEKCTFLSKDLAPILFNLADAVIDGSLTLSGDEHVLVFRYSNDIGAFEIAVPAFDRAAEERDRTLFAGRRK